MKSKLFHGIITTFIVSITVSIADITLAGNRQPQTRTLSQAELSCISDKLQERAEHDESAKFDKLTPYDEFTILEKLAKLNERRIVYICLNDNDLQIFTGIRKKGYQQEQAFNDDGTKQRHRIKNTERPRRIDNYVFFSELKNINVKNIGSEVFKAMQESLKTTKTPQPGPFSKPVRFFKLRRIK